MRYKSIPKRVRELVYQKCDGHCAYCGKPIEYKDMQVDHIKPVFHNWNYVDKERWLKEHYGDDSIENLNPSCRACNYYKSSMSLESLRSELGHLLERLDKTFTYRLAKSYGLIEEHPQDIKFYFEKAEENGKQKQSGIASEG